MRSIDKKNFIDCVASHSVRMKRNGDVTVLPAHAKDMKEPSLRQMFVENRKIRKDLLKMQKQGINVDERLTYVRRRARWIQHEMREQAEKLRT